MGAAPDQMSEHCSAPIRPSKCLEPLQASGSDNMGRIICPTGRKTIFANIVPGSGVGGRGLSCLRVQPPSECLSKSVFHGPATAVIDRTTGAHRLLYWGGWEVRQHLAQHLAGQHSRHHRFCSRHLIRDATQHSTSTTKTTRATTAS